MDAEVTAREKRKEPRYPTDANVEVCSGNEKKSWAAGCNISRSGIMIISSQGFSPSEQLSLKIVEAGKELNARATVMYCRQNSRGFHVGCSAEFADMA